MRSNVESDIYKSASVKHFSLSLSPHGCCSQCRFLRWNFAVDLDSPWGGWDVVNSYALRPAAWPGTNDHVHCSQSHFISPPPIILKIFGMLASCVHHTQALFCLLYGSSDCLICENSMCNCRWSNMYCQYEVGPFVNLAFLILRFQSRTVKVVTVGLQTDS